MFDLYQQSPPDILHQSDLGIIVYLIEWHNAQLELDYPDAKERLIYQKTINSRFASIPEFWKLKHIFRVSYENRILS